MNVLYYWRPDNYWRDRKFGFGYHLNQNSPVLPLVAPGETVWAFTRDKLRRYALAAALAVKAVTRNPPNYRYGHHRVWASLGDTQYFDIDMSPDAEELIRSLQISARADILAQSFQGHRAVKPLSVSDHYLLAAFAANLPVLGTAGIYLEDEFEARLLLGTHALESLLRDSDIQRTTRLKYLFESVDIKRARRHVEWLQANYQGRCQVCLFDPHDRYGRNLCHGHHIHWLSRGGEDTLENMVLICPNHHAAVHQDDAVFDYRDLTFRFTRGLTESIRLNHHLDRAA